MTRTHPVAPGPLHGPPFTMLPDPWTAAVTFRQQSLVDQAQERRAASFAAARTPARPGGLRLRLGHALVSLGTTLEASTAHPEPGQADAPEARTA